MVHLRMDRRRGASLANYPGCGNQVGWSWAGAFGRRNDEAGSGGRIPGAVTEPAGQRTALSGTVRERAGRVAGPCKKRPSADAVGRSLRTMFDGQRAKSWAAGRGGSNSAGTGRVYSAKSPGMQVGWPHPARSGRVWTLPGEVFGRRLAANRRSRGRRDEETRPHCVHGGRATGATVRTRAGREDGPRLKRPSVNAVEQSLRTMFDSQHAKSWTLGRGFSTGS